MNFKTKNLFVGAITVATAITPMTTLAYNTVEENTSTDSSKTNNLNNRGVESRISGNSIANEDINLRKTDSWKGEIIEVIKKGEPVFVMSSSGEFSKVKHDEKTGYVPTKHLKEANNIKKVTDNVNLRKNDSWSGEIIHVVNKGEEISLISNNGEFSKVQHEGSIGYIPTKYIEGTSSNATNNKKVTDSVNLRTSASWSADIIHVVKKGETVNVLSSSGEFSKVEHNGKTGYIPTKYIEGMGGSSSTPTTNNKKVTESVNLRKDDSWSGEVIHVVKKGETVNVLSNNGEFSKVEHNGKTGYIPTKYIEGMGGSSSSTPTTNNKKVTESVNLRKTASWSGEVIHVVKKGETVNVLSNSGEFSKVEHNGKTGYIPTKYIEGMGGSSNSGSTSNPNIESMNKTGKVVNLKSGDTLNVRSQADPESKILGTLSNGASVKITGKDKKTGWYRIDFNGKDGYVNDYYIQISSSSSESSSTYKKTTENLNLRTGPSTKESIILTIPKGTVVKVISSSNGWDYVEYNGKKGYCSDDYLVATNEVPVTKYITTENLVFRKGPGTNHDKILTIPKGTVIDVISISGDWAKIKYDGKEGYVHTDYIEKYNGSSSGGGSSTLPPSKPSYSRVKIVVDAGHGGHDSGATSFGRYEKDLALAISKKVNANLKTLGFQTIMTRSTDVYIPLSERYSIANNNKADMFVSIHLNSGPSSAHGIETLYKNSKTYASNIQQEIIKTTGARDRGLKYRDDLAVLNGTRMPAALVETGFITNSSESSNLASGSYQDKLASSIARGIAKYTDNNISK